MVAFVAADTLERQKVVLMDWTRGEAYTNYIFRGNEPKMTNSTGDYFAYDLLKQYLTEEAANRSIHLPDQFQLIDYKLYFFKDPFEEPDIKLENDFFIDNPTLGELRLQSILGDLTSPSIYPTFYIKSEAISLSSWQPDNLPKFIQTLHTLLYTPGPKNLPVVIYFHCECGCDRTGEVAGSYAMQYLNMTFYDAYAWDQSIAGRWILPNNEWAMEWYCSYLQYAMNMKVDPCWYDDKK